MINTPKPDWEYRFWKNGTMTIISNKLNLSVTVNGRMDQSGIDAAIRIKKMLELRSFMAA